MAIWPAIIGAAASIYGANKASKSADAQLDYQKEALAEATKAAKTQTMMSGYLGTPLRATLYGNALQAIGGFNPKGVDQRLVDSVLEGILSAAGISTPSPEQVEMYRPVAMSYASLITQMGNERLYDPTITDATGTKLAPLQTTNALQHRVRIPNPFATVAGIPYSPFSGGGGTTPWGNVGNIGASAGAVTSGPDTGSRVTGDAIFTALKAQDMRYGSSIQDFEEWVSTLRPDSWTHGLRDRDKARQARDRIYGISGGKLWAQQNLSVATLDKLGIPRSG